MAKDWIIVRMIFSGALILFGILHMIYTVFSSIIKHSRFKKDLHSIKHFDVQRIVEESLQDSEDSIDNGTIKKEVDTLLKDIYFNLYNQHKNSQEIQENYSEIELSIDNVLDSNILNIIEEKDRLLQEKDRIIVMLEEKNEKFINDTITKISYIVESKDQLLQEKDNSLMQQAKKITELENKIHQFLNGGGKKIWFILQEKDKLLREKDTIILALHKKLQWGENSHISISQPQIVSLDKGRRSEAGEGFVKEHIKQKYYYSEHFVNVNG